MENNVETIAALNMVTIDKTFRVNAKSVNQVVNMYIETLVSDKDPLVTKRISSISDKTYKAVLFYIIGGISFTKVVYVDETKEYLDVNGLKGYRLEVGNVTLTGVERLQIMGGDAAVNAVGFYQENYCGKGEIYSSAKYREKLSYWAAVDVEKGLGMVENFKSNTQALKMVNGRFVPLEDC